MKFIWTSYEFHMNKIDCIAYEIHKNFIWTSYEFHTKFTINSYVDDTNFMWSYAYMVSYGLHMNEPPNPAVSCVTAMIQYLKRLIINPLWFSHRYKAINKNDKHLENYWYRYTSVDLAWICPVYGLLTSRHQHTTETYADLLWMGYLATNFSFIAFENISLMYAKSLRLEFDNMTTVDGLPQKGSQMTSGWTDVYLYHIKGIFCSFILVVWYIRRTMCNITSFKQMNYVIIEKRPLFAW